MQHAATRAGALMSVRYGRRVYRVAATLAEAFDTPVRDSRERQIVDDGALVVGADGVVRARLEAFRMRDGVRYLAWLVERGPAVPDDPADSPLEGVRP